MKNIVLIAFALVFSLALNAQKTNQSEWQQQVDYTINVSLNDVVHTLAGDISISYHNNSPNDLSEMYIHLWPNAYANNNTAFGKQMEENGDLAFFYAEESERGNIADIKFASDDSEISWDYALLDSREHIDIAHLHFDTPIKSGETRTITTPFTVKVPEVFSRLGHQDQDYFITQWFPKPAVYDVNGWNPMPYLNLGEFYSEFGTFEVNITVPENYTVVATGECQTDGEMKMGKAVYNDTTAASSEVFKTVRFTATDVHDFAWFASKRWGYKSKKIIVQDKSVTLRVVGANPDVKDLEHIKTAIEYYSEHVGLYPYSHATVVHGELKAGGGMEYPMITLCDYMNEEVIVHEVGHNWFYGILANNERTYPWMDESINSYYEGEAMSQGDDTSADINGAIMLALVKDNLLRGEHQAIGTESATLTEGNYGMSVYGMGAKAFGYLKAYLGEAMFKKCMTTYYQEWKFKHPLPQDMQASFERTSGKDLGWFFEEVLNTGHAVDFAICKHKHGYKVKNKSKVKAAVPVYFTRDGEETTEWYIIPADTAILIADTSARRSAQLDKLGQTIDLIYKNNSTANQFNLRLGSGVDKPNSLKTYIIPTLGWNYYDKMMLGLGIHNYSLGDKALHYHILPMYSLEKKKLNGEAELLYTKPFEGATQYLELGVKARRYSFNGPDRLLRTNEGNVRAAYSYFKVKPYLTYHFPKISARSTVSKEIRLAIDQIYFQPQVDFIDLDTLPGPEFSRAKSHSFATLTYERENKRSINRSKISLNLEYGQLTNLSLVGEEQYIISGTDSTRYFLNNREETNTSYFAKLWGVYNYDLDVGMKDKPLEIRVFGSVMLKSSAVNLYNNGLGSTDHAGYFDYKFDDYLMNRNAEVGLFQNQINNRTNASKFVGPISLGNQWLLSGQVTMPLPGKIPFKPYLEVVMFDDLEEQSWNTSGQKLIYNIGIELEVVKDRFEIFFNLAQSIEVTDYQEGAMGLPYPATVSGFAERITFVLDLNGLTPSRLKRGLSLF